MTVLPEKSASWELLCNSFLTCFNSLVLAASSNRYWMANVQFTFCSDKCSGRRLLFRLCSTFDWLDNESSAKHERNDACHVISGVLHEETLVEHRPRERYHGWRDVPLLSGTLLFSFVCYLVSNYVLCNPTMFIFLWDRIHCIFTHIWTRNLILLVKNTRMFSGTAEAAARISQVHYTRSNSTCGICVSREVRWWQVQICRTQHVCTTSQELNFYFFHGWSPGK